MATVSKNLSEYDIKKVTDASTFRFGIVVSEWNKSITDNLLKGALTTLKENGAGDENIVVWHVPGSYELIYGCSQMIKTQTVDAVIAIGSLIKGETMHFDFIGHSVSQGIKDLNLQTDTPTIFCVLTDDTTEQAIDRSGGKHGNKGIACAVAAIRMAELKNRIN